MPGAIVPYTAYTAASRMAVFGAMAARRRAQARAAAMGVAYAYKHRKTAYRAAKVIGRAYRRYRRRRSRLMGRIGKAPSVASSKRCAIVGSESLQNYDTRTLYELDMTAIPATTTNEIDKRQRDIARFGGFKICCMARNNLTVPLYLNMAVVFDKKDPTTFVSGNDFFRGNGDSRSQDFSTTTLSAMGFHCLPLNKDRFTILWHSRKILGAGTSPINNFSNYSRENHKVFKRWIPLKKQITYTEGSANSKIWLLWWCDRMQGAPGDPITSQAVSMQRHVVSYFREPAASRI